MATDDHTPVVGNVPENIVEAEASWDGIVVTKLVHARELLSDVRIVLRDHLDYSVPDVDDVVRLANINLQISKLKGSVDGIESMINALEQNVYAVCDHQWEVDRACIDEHTLYKCKICGKYR